MGEIKWREKSVFFEAFFRNVASIPFVLLKFVCFILCGLFWIMLLISGIAAIIFAFQTQWSYCAIAVGVGVVCYFLAHLFVGFAADLGGVCDKVQVKNVCPRCNKNNGIHVTNEELIHEGRWRRVQINPDYVVDVQENIYNVTYSCSNCGYGYTIQQTKENSKRV